MGVYPVKMEELIGLLSRLPNLGPRSATRIAFFLLQQPRELSESLGRLILQLKDTVVLCSSCYNISDMDPCNICRDPKRDRGSILVVESPGDLFAIEETSVYKGLYHILHGVISPLDSIGPEDLKIGALVERLKGPGIEELIIATNPTFQGDATASYLMDLIERQGINIRVSRIAVGLPMGGDLKFTDKVTLAHAIKERRRI